MKSKEELKKLFENGDKPTQENFWDWQNSYWHKDEKLPTETAGLYKIKGSVPDLTALNLMNSMTEGDVYNLLDTGDNYVYVLDLNNTGEAGWDKLSGLMDFKSITLQTIVDNGINTGTAAMSTDGNSLIDINPNSQFYSTFINPTSKKASSIVQSENWITFQRYFDTDLGITATVNLEDGGLRYDEDYSQRDGFDARCLVDKAYVDSKVNLQSVLENGNSAISPNQSSFTIDLPNSNINSAMYDTNMSRLGYFSQDYGSFILSATYDIKGFITFEGNTSQESPFIRLSASDNSSNNNAYLLFDANNLLSYFENYSDRFTPRSLVDKAYVDSKLSSPPESWSPWTNCIIESYQPTTFNQLRWRRKGDRIQIDGVAVRENDAPGGPFAFIPASLNPSVDMRFVAYNVTAGNPLIVNINTYNRALTFEGSHLSTDAIFFTIEYTI